MYKTGLAVALSLLLPGAGHIYARKRKLGLGLIFVYLAGIVAFICFPYLDLEKKSNIGFALLMILLFSIYDSRNTVRRLNKQEERLREGGHVNHEDEEYYFRLNLYNLSTVPIHIFNNDGKSIGTMQRYYKHWWVWFISTLSELEFIYVKGIDQQGREVVNIEELSLWKSLFSKCLTLQVTVGQGPEQERFLLKNTTYHREGISVNHIFEFEYKGEKYTFKKDFMIKTSTIKNGKGKTIVEFIQEDPVSAMDHGIHILDPSVDLLLVTTIYFAFLSHR